MIDDIVALLWSKRQNTLHIEPLAETCKQGARACSENRPCDYIVIFAGTRDECSAIADSVRPTLHARSHAPARAFQAAQ